MARLGVKKPRFAGLKSADGPSDVLSVVGVGLGAVALLPLIAASVKADQWGLTAAWTSLLAVTLVVVYRLLTRDAPSEPVSTRYFRPFADPETQWLWPRDVEVRALESVLTASQPAVALVVGASGMGKTILLSRLLPDSMGRVPNTDYFHISTYEPTHHRLIEAADHPRAIVVLDQFEQHLAYMHSLPADRREKEEAWLRDEYLTGYQSNDTRFVIAVRQEWYFHLKFLAPILPDFKHTITISPPADTVGDPARDVIINQLVEGLGLRDVDTAERIAELLARDRDGRLLPLEVQIVGAALERAARHNNVGPSYLENRLGGVPGAINEYFDAVVRGAPDRRVALKVLCALSARTRFRRQEALHNILEAVFEPTHDVEEAISYLEKHNLVVAVDRAGTKFELAHDYLAELFHQKTATDLDPTERDNVQFHITEIESGGSPEKSIVIPLAERDERDESNSRGSLTRLVLTVLVTLMTFRLLYFDLPWYLADAGPRPRPVVGNSVLDQTYLIVYVPQLAWAIYLCMFYDRVFRNLRESGWERAFSRLTVIIVLPCAVAAMFYPDVWILSIGVCGLVIGLKMTTIGRARNVNPAARERVTSMGRITTGNMLLALLVGGMALGLSRALVHGDADTREWTLLMIPWSVLFTIACVWLAPSHVQRPATALTLGLLARPVTPLVPRPES